MKKKPELLVPASSLEVLKVAVVFGADAVYIGGEAFGLRAKAKNFSMEEIKEGIAFAHAHGVRVYVTANILAHNRDLEGVRAYFEELKNVIVDTLNADAEAVTMEASLADDLNADSLDAVELNMALEEKFGTAIPDEELGNMKTVGDIFNYLTKNA